jgi:hypothetical protein
VHICFPVGMETPAKETCPYTKPFFSSKNAMNFVGVGLFRHSLINARDYFLMKAGHILQERPTRRPIHCNFCWMGWAGRSAEFSVWFRVHICFPVGMETPAKETYPYINGTGGNSFVESLDIEHKFCYYNFRTFVS